MSTHAEPARKPLWMSMENLIQGLTDQDLADRENTVRRLAGGLDEEGFNVSGHAANMLELRAALDERRAAGRPLMDDFQSAVGALGLDDVIDPKRAAVQLALQVGEAFPLLKSLERRTDLERLMTRTRLDLLIAHARELGGEQGVRYLIGAELEIDTILAGLEITRETYDEVDARIAAEKAERKRVRGLLDDRADSSELDRIKHLITNDVAEDLILELAAVDQGAIDAAKQAMAEEIAEKKRLAEEAAARKKAEAEGPSLDAISDDEMLEYIEGIREIMEFSDVPEEIRTMCEQSDMPKALIEIAVNEPAKLDELESKAGG